MTKWQVRDSLVFHEYAVLDRQIVKVSSWWPSSQPPWEPGRYQGLVPKSRGEKVVEEFYWDGARWRNLKTGRITRKPFEWRGMQGPPGEDNED